LLEATACGCPVVATSHGGPVEILRNCENGLLVEPTDTPAVQAALRKLLTDEELWQRSSTSGLKRVREHYSWESHVSRYLQLMEENRKDSKGRGRKNPAANPKLHERLKAVTQMIISDIDGTLISETEDYSGLEELKAVLSARENKFAFGIASGRSLDKVQAILGKFDIPTPDVVISSVGTMVHYGLDPLFQDKGWEKHIGYAWDPDAIRDRLATVTSLELQEPENQNPFKISYYIHDPSLTVETVSGVLGDKLSRYSSIVITQSAYLDILPNRASKGRAVRYVGNKWSIPINRIVVCGDAGNDLDMFTGATRGIVVGNHSPEMESLRGMRRVYFAQAPSAAGILEGLEHFKFLKAAT